jgi:hypothetical protein
MKTGSAEHKPLVFLIRKITAPKMYGKIHCPARIRPANRDQIQNEISRETIGGVNRRKHSDSQWRKAMMEYLSRTANRNPHKTGVNGSNPLSPILKLNPCRTAWKDHF